jgi:hypothetical protein
MAKRRRLFRRAFRSSHAQCAKVGRQSSQCRKWAWPPRPDCALSLRRNSADPLSPIGSFDFNYDVDGYFIRIVGDLSRQAK